MAFRYRALAVTVGVIVAGCTLSPTPSSITGVAGLDRDIERYYSGRAWERSASCTRPSMRVIGADEISRNGDEVTFSVRYFWSQGNVEPGNTCRGSGERRFVVDLEGGDARVVAMTGEQR
ncbi:MAG: hypothetical protein AAFX81_20020 [Pseudomonadota bacterium]